MAGSIQGDINHALGTLGALATFSPQLQEHAEKMAEGRKIKKEEKVLNEQIASATSTGKALRPEVEEDFAERSKDIARRKFELKPSQETYEAYNQELSRLDKMSQAMSRVGRQSEAKKTQKRNFMDYISKMPMLGETVGSIDARNPGFAKQVASQYSRSDRRRMMDQMDREAKDGKQK